MTTEDEFSELLLPIIRAIAGQQSITRGAIQTLLQTSDVSSWGAKRKTKTLIRCARQFRAQLQYGRFRGALLLGVADLGVSFLTTFERNGLLLCDGRSPARFGKFLAELKGSSGPEWDPLCARVQTYYTYHEFVHAVSRETRNIAKPLAVRPRHVIKRLLGLANLAFLQKHLEFELPPQIQAAIEEFGTPEAFASATSALVALANDERPLDSWDLALPTVDELEDPKLWALLKFGRTLSVRHEMAKQISLFGYVFDKRGDDKHPTYYLAPPWPAFESSLRLGYTRAEVSTPWLELSKQTGVPDITLTSIADLFLRVWRDRICEVRDDETSYRRLRVNFPIIPGLIDLVTESDVFDDAFQRETLACEFMFPLRLAASADGPMMLTPTMPLVDFMRIWRMVRFLVLADISAIRPYSSSDPVVFLNSTVRVCKRGELVDLISAMGFESARVDEFLTLVTADVDAVGYYDMQYRPFLHLAPVHNPITEEDTPAELIYAPALVATANILRNVQVANKVRLREMADTFVSVIALLLGQHLGEPVINRRVKSPSGATDIDVVLWHGDVLYLFECKHSVFPTEQHEIRDTWEDIEKGVHQLHLAEEALRPPQKLKDYLAGWFPGRSLPKDASLRISPCVICSHRVFSGMEYDGIPVRDYASLAMLSDDGIVSVGSIGEDLDIAVKRFQLTSSDHFTAADLDDYLHRDAKYFKMFAPFMHEIATITDVAGVKVAHETFVFQGDFNEWEENLQTIGATRLPDEFRKIVAPLSTKEILAKIAADAALPPAEPAQDA